ncbi:glycosyl hydrolase 1 family protein [Streptococcus pyogenes MGAS2111]|nr:glycosyl hydrolase 1 family protein [Streptococcus pyogenes MGAS2111]
MGSYLYAWSRIFPTGKGEVNPKGVEYYHNLLQSVISVMLSLLLHFTILIHQKHFIQMVISSIVRTLNIL